MSQDWSAKIRHHAQSTNSLQDFENAMEREIGGDRNKRLDAANWAEKANTRAYDRLNTAYPVEELANGVQTINFRNNTSPGYDAWYDKMTHTTRKPIPLGCTTQALYQLRADPCGLFPDNRSKGATMRHLGIMSSCFLGVNTNVPPPGNIPTATYPPPRIRNPGQREEQRTDESTETTTSEDDSTGFVFHQLGALQSAAIPSGPENYPEPDDFFRTGFYVVAKLSPSGMAVELWIIQDKYPDDVDGERDDEPDQDVGELWMENLKISMARLYSGDDIPLLSNRTFGTPIKWLEQNHDQMELVNVRRMPDGSLVRLTVFP